MKVTGKNIHFIGVGGIGVSALARLCKLSGANVSGSDIRQSPVTDNLEKLGCQIFIGHDAQNVADNTNLVVHTEDVNETSAGFVELKKAHDAGIETLKYSEALGDFMKGFQAIGVSGTNGKSTTTAILGLIMEAAETDPMVVLGSKLSVKNESDRFQANARFGNGKIFVYEADEYHRHMLDTKPFAAIITNIEEDHLDYYKNLDDIISAFTSYAASLPADGLLIYNLDDPNVAAVVTSAPCRTVSISMKDPHADYFVENVRTQGHSQLFNVMKAGQVIGEFKLNIPGEYNVMNALAAIAMALELEVEPEVAQTALSNFAGIWRRFEVVGKFGNADVVSDYAHHPTAITGLIAAAKQFYPEEKILLVFQPHQKNRTKMLFNDFVKSLRGVDRVILPEIYFVPGREKEEDSDISSLQLAEAVSKLGQPCDFTADLEQAEKKVREIGSDFDLIICAGAGTIDSLARKLTS